MTDMDLICKNCGASIDGNDVNIRTDLAKCAKCGAISKLSELVYEVPSKKMGAKAFDPTPPRGSKITIRPEGSNIVSLQTAKAGLKAGQIVLLVFSIFWLAFVSFWTMMAATASVLFAAFSIPFWIVGLLMFVGVIKSARAQQTILLSSESITITKDGLFGTKSQTVRLSDIDKVDMISFTPGFQEMGTMAGASNTRRYNKSVTIYAPALISGLTRYRFLETADEMEQQWAMGFLNEWLRKFKR